jgi:TetR/AcrR family transcriptional repressor of nem operon
MARPRTYTRDEVLRRATDLFSRKGYEGAHLQELVEVTGLNRFSLYKEFGGKEGLFQAALEAYLGTLAELDAHLRREPLGLANLRAFNAASLAHEYPYGCLAVNTIREKHVVPPQVFAVIEKFATSGEEGFRRNLLAAQKAGELPADTDVEALAKFLAAINMGLSTYGIVAKDPKDRARIVSVAESLLGSGKVPPKVTQRARGRGR